MHCGQPLAASPVPTAAQQVAGPAAATGMPLSQAFDAQRRRNRAAVGGAALLALVAAFFGLRATGLLKIGASQPDGGNLKLHASAGPAALEKPGAISPAPLEKPATVITMPDDIRKWLEHLHQCELKRVAVTTSALNQAMVEKEKLSVNGGADAVQDALNGIDDPNSELHSPVDSLAAMIKKMHDDMADLQKLFDSYPAPDECQPIQAAYDQAVGEERDELGDLADHLAANDMEKIQSMKGMSNSGIDAAGAKTDRLVGEICDKYNTKKWFSINKDIGGAGVLSIPGF
ncbi:MAG TPA: hypothetical protein VG944_18445 [Fimbriimonas sp.]|nr:hypothetical protein [Fimbriimonas sp.]